MPRITVDYSEGQFLILKTCRPSIFVPEMDIYLDSAVVIKRMSTMFDDRFELDIPPYGVDQGDISRWVFDENCVNETKTVFLQVLLT